MTQQIDIAYRAIVEYEKQTDLVKEFRVTKSRICCIVNKVIKNKEAYEEMIQKKDDQETKRAAIRRTVKTMVVEKEIIDSA